MRKLLAKGRTIHYDLGCMICGLVMIAFSAIMIVYLIPHWCSIGRGLSSIKWNSQTLPYVVSALNLLLGILLALRYGRRYYIYKKDPEKAGDVRQVSFTLIALVIIAIGFLYVGFFKMVGYIPTTIVFMILLYFLFGGKKWIEAIILSVVFTAVCVAFFYFYLKLAMPLIWFY